MSSSTDPADHLHALGDAVPVGTPSVPDLIAGGRRIRRRRTTLATLSAAAAVVLVVAGGAVAVSLGGHRGSSVVVAVGPNGLPAAAPGYKYVGRGRVVVQVLQNAELLTDRCGGTRPGYSFDRKSIPPCPTFTPGPRTGPRVDLQPASGRPGVIPSFCGPNVCIWTVTVDEVQVRMSGTEAEVDRLRSSIAVLPDGLTAVPLVNGLAPQAAAAATGAVGLNLEFASTPMSHLIVRSQKPVAGTIVKSGSTVVADAEGRTIVPMAPARLRGEWFPVRVRGKAVPGRARAAGAVTFTKTTVTAATGCAAVTRRYSVEAQGQFHVGPVNDLFHCLASSGGSSFQLLADTASLSLTPTFGARRQLVLRNARGREIARYRTGPRVIGTGAASD